MLLLALHHDNKTFFPLEGREVVKGVSEDRENLNNLVILSRNIPRTITMFTSETGRTIASDSTGRAAGVTEATPTPPPSPAGVFDPLSVQERCEPHPGAKRVSDCLAAGRVKQLATNLALSI